MRPGIVRALAICIFRNVNKILVGEHYDAVKRETFYRPLGGTIEFGETSKQTIEREIKEELSAKVVNLRYVGNIESHFTYNGEKGHEIVVVYQGDLADRSFYKMDSIVGTEDDGVPFNAVWKSLDFFQSCAAPLYPDGLFELMQKEFHVQGH